MLTLDQAVHVDPRQMDQVRVEAAARHDLLERGIDEARLKEIDMAIRARVAEAADFAETSPEPDPAELNTDVLVSAY